MSSHLLFQRLSCLPRWPWILIVVGLVPRIILSFGSSPVLWPDSITYLGSAALMADQGNYWLHEIYRTPLYPLFLSIPMRIFGHTAETGECIVFLQRIMGIASGLLLFLILRRAFNHRVAFGGSVLFLISPLQLFYETSLLTEVQFIFFLFVFLWIAGAMLERGHLTPLAHRWFVALGLLGAILSLSRPIGQLLLLAVLVYYFFQFGFSRRLFFGAATSLLVFFVGVFPWLKINHDHYGFWGISRDFGINLYHRVIDVDRTPLPPISSDEFIRDIYLKAAQKPQVTYFTVYHALLRKLRREGDRRTVKLRADQRMGDFAKEVLLSSPGQFIPNSISNFFHLFIASRRSVHFCSGGDGTPYLCSNHEGMSTRSVQVNPERPSALWRQLVSWMFRALVIPDVVVAFLCLVGVFASLRLGAGPPAAKSQRLAILLSILYFTLLAALFNCPEDRFRLPVDGFIYGFAIYGVLVTGGCILHRWSVRR